MTTKMPKERKMTCAAKDCGYVYNKDVRINVFKFPFGIGTDVEYEKWMRNMQVNKGLKINRDSVYGICEQHFLKRCFHDYEQGACLKVGAIPTLLQVGLEREWRKIAPDHDALGEEHTQELRDRVELDHTYRDPSHTSSYQGPGEEEEGETPSEDPPSGDPPSEDPPSGDPPSVDPLPPKRTRRPVVPIYNPDIPSTMRKAAAPPPSVTKPAPSERSSPAKPASSKGQSRSLSYAKAQAEDFKKQLHSKDLQLKRLEFQLSRRDEKYEDLQYAIDKLKSVLDCCECGLKPSSEAELQKMLKRKREKKPSEDSSGAGKKPKANLPTKVVCRNDLVVSLTWKQLFARVSRIGQEDND